MADLAGMVFIIFMLAMLLTFVGMAVAMMILVWREIFLMIMPDREP